MRTLLEKWEILEPGKCPVSALAAKDIQEQELMRIQWAVQRAAIEKEWYFNLSFHPLHSGYKAEVGGKRKWAESSTEALLLAYLAALESYLAALELVALEALSDDNR